MTLMDRARALAVRQQAIAAEAAELARSFSEDELGEEMLATCAADAARRAVKDLEELARRLGGTPFAVFAGATGNTHTA